MPAIATIYEHSNYSGRALQLQGVGDYDYSTLASFGFNDLTSSIKIESGYYLKAYADAGFKGASAIFTGSSSYVGDGFNDKISSLKLIKGTPTATSPKPAASSFLPGSSSSSDPFWLNLANQLDQQAAAISKKVKQGVWNKSGFVLDVAWIDPITGNTVKNDRISLGQGSTIVHSSNEEPYKVKLSVWGKTLAEFGIAAVGTAFTAGGLALAGGALGGAAAWGVKMGGT